MAASYRYKFVGRTKLPWKLTTAEAEEFCRLRPEVVAAIQGSGKHRSNWLGLAAQVSFLAVTGRHAVDDVRLPPAMLGLLCEQLELERTAIAAFASLYASSRTMRDHRQWAREALGFTDFDASARTKLTDALAIRARTADSPDDLNSFANDWLFDARIVIPGVTTVDELARQAFRVVEDLARNTVAEAVGTRQLKAVLKEMYEESVIKGTTILEWLKTSVGKHVPSHLEEVAAKISYLKLMGAHAWNLSALNHARIRAFALRVIHRPPSETAKRIELTQSVELVCFLKYTLLQLSDEAGYRGIRRTSDLIRMGAQRVQKIQAARGTDRLQVLQAVHDLAGDSSKTPKQRLASIREMTAEAIGAQKVSHASVVRDTLTEQSTRVRAVLNSLDVLDIHGDADSKDERLVEALRHLRKSDAKELPADFDLSIVEPSWRDHLDNPDRKRAYQAFEACTLMRIRKGLLGGRLWIDHSTDYRNRKDLLIPEDEWKRDRLTICESLGLEVDPHKALALQYELVKLGLVDMQAHISSGLLTVADGEVSVAALRAAEMPPKLEQTRADFAKRLGPTQLPDIILDIDSRCHFSEILLGRRAEDALELKALYAALLSHASEVDAKGAAAMIPGVDVAHVTAAMRNLEIAGRLRTANDRIVSFQQKFPIVKSWDDGTKASADMMALDATRHLFNARTDPRRRTMAAGLYTHVLGSYPIIYDQPIVLMTRQAAPAVEGVDQYNAAGDDRTRVERLAVDTHGFTYPAMTLAKLLRFDLCPQLADLPEQKLWLPSGMEVPDALDRVAVANISERAIVDGWDPLLRVVASVRIGRVSAEWVLSRAGSAARGDRVHRALDNFGRFLRTVFLCDYFTNESFRRELHTLLNRGESVHQLQRAIYYGRLSAERGRRRDELRVISGSHALVTNLVVAWNTMRMQEVVDQRREARAPIPDDMLRHIGPVHFGSINFRGQMSFGVERYADVLLQQKDARRQPRAN